MRLSRVSVGGFQSYRAQQTVELDDHLTLVAGRNNVGKSALLRALTSVEATAAGIHDDFSVEYAWSLGLEQLDAALSTGDERLRMLSAKVDREAQPLIAEFVAFGTAAKSPAPSVICRRVELPAVGASAVLAPGRKGGWREGPLQGEAAGLDGVVALATALAKDLRYVAPRRIDLGRQYLNSTSAQALESDARNLTPYLQRLQANSPRDVAPAINRFVHRAFPDVELVHVGLDDDAAGTQTSSRPFVYFAGRDDPVPLEDCGTGLAQMVALAAMIESATRPTVFLIDEPQAYLHPHAEAVLLGMLAEHPQHQYVIATHSQLMLRAVALSQARLLTLEDGATVVHQPTQPLAVLDELGVNAGDLWLNDRLLWVEGETEVAILRTIVEREWPTAEAAGLEIRAMPVAASAFSAKRERHAANAFRFCEEVVDAVTPLGVEMLFLFDREDRDEVQLTQIQRASGGRAEFLEVRESENLFLDVRLLSQALSRRCVECGLQPPTEADIDGELQTHLANTDSSELFGRQRASHADARSTVRGSVVLDKLFWRYTSTPYRKVPDGRALTEAALELDANILAPLRALLARLRR